MSKGYAGPDVAFVHPQERAVDMRSEWDVRLELALNPPS
jgi:hypothetical protein